MKLYKLQRTSDGRWHGRKVRFKDEWHRDEGRYYTKKALEGVLAGFKDDGLSGGHYLVVEFVVDELCTYSLELFIGGLK